MEYQVIEISIDEKSERLVVASDLAAVLGEDRKVIATFKGKELEHTKYARPFDFVEIKDSHFVVLADYVTVEDGTGLVHQSPNLPFLIVSGCQSVFAFSRSNSPLISVVLTYHDGWA